ncbi:MAG: T9SS type A sorting domain-containing protein [Bacteroidia bacterium]|nr:T9SS type A sorting domain-containing protein [Bacteroidia bacterium]
MKKLLQFSWFVIVFWTCLNFTQGQISATLSLDTTIIRVSATAPSGIHSIRYRIDANKNNLFTDEVVRTYTVPVWADTLGLIPDVYGIEVRVYSNSNDSLILTDSLEIINFVLPNNLFAVQGHPLEVYFNNSLLSRKAKFYSYAVSTTFSGFSQDSFKVGFFPLATHVGQHPLKITVRNQSQTRIIAVDSSILFVSPQTTAAPDTMEIWLLGHSYYGQARCPDTVKKLLDLPGNSNYILQGRFTTLYGAKHEGNSGQTWDWYINNSASPLRDGTRLNVPNYYDNICNDTLPKYVAIFLDINDLAPISPSSTIAQIDAAIDFMYARAKILIDSIRKATPNVIIGICTTPPFNGRDTIFQIRYSPHPEYMNRWRWRRIYHRLLERNLKLYDGRENEKFWIIPTHAYLDEMSDYWGLPIVDALHPTHKGYGRIGRSIYYWLKHQMRLREPGPPFPIEWLDLKAKSVTAGVKLNWKIISDVQCSDFVIERGKSPTHLQRIATLPINCAIGETNEFDYLDTQPIEGISYYQVKAIDIDGNQKYSPLVEVRFDKQKPILCYPNPATTDIHLELPNLPVEVTVFASDGRTVWQGFATESLTISVQNFPTGIYWVQIKDSESIMQTLKFIRL